MQSWSILGSSSSPFQSVARCCDDGPCGFRAEKKQACLVLLRLKPPAHRPFTMMDLYLEELPVWHVCSFQFKGICFKEIWFGLIATPWLCPCNARLYRIVPFWSARYSMLGLSAERLGTSIHCSLFQTWECSSSFKSFKTYDQRSAPSASWQPPCRRILMQWLAMWIPFCALLLPGLSSIFVHWQQST